MSQTNIKYFRTYAEAKEFYDYCRPEGGRPDMSAYPPFECIVYDKTLNSDVKGWGVEVVVWTS